MSERETPDEAVAFIRALVSAWDCCGTCAGGVLAKRDRERDAARLAKVEALADKWRAWRLKTCRACRDEEFAKVHSHDCGRTTRDVEAELRVALAPDPIHAQDGDLGQGRGVGFDHSSSGRPT